MVPKLTLQPLAENALYHGIKNKRGKGKILIEGFDLGEDMMLRVTDNGQGMTPERLHEVQEAIRTGETSRIRTCGGIRENCTLLWTGIWTEDFFYRGRRNCDGSVYGEEQIMSTNDELCDMNIKNKLIIYFYIYNAQ